MQGPRASRSLRRRVLFAGHSRLFFDNLAARLPRLPGGKAYRRVPDKLATIGFDLLECLRTGRRTPYIGEVRQAAAFGPTRCPQHPRYPSYWYDPSRHALVGMHLGIDLIKRAGKFHVIENNLGAALRPERRALYDAPVDPLIAGLVGCARDQGFATLVVWRDWWDADQREEFALAGREAGIEVQPASPPDLDPATDFPMTAMPDPLPERTMYVLFSSSNTPVEFFVHDKLASAAWLERGIREDPDGPLGPVETRRSLFLPPDSTETCWPNLAIKLAGWDEGQRVMFGRFESMDEARRALGLRRDSDAPRAFRQGLLDRLGNKVFGRGTPLYQEFVPPDRDKGDRMAYLRLHMLISPLVDAYLSAHWIVSPTEIPSHLPAGTVISDNTFNLSFAKGARYERPEPEIREPMAAVATAFGEIAKRSIAEKFDVGPRSDPCSGH